MLEELGDLWGMEGDARCVTTNNVVGPGGRLVMGGGVAREARDRYPGLDLTWGQARLNTGGPGVWVFTATGADPPLVSFPTKNHYREPSELGLINDSALALRTLTDRHGWTRVLLPRPGVGLGGLSWEDVGPFLASVLDDRFVAVTWA